MVNILERIQQISVHGQYDKLPDNSLKILDKIDLDDSFRNNFVILLFGYSLAVIAITIELNYYYISKYYNSYRYQKKFSYKCKNIRNKLNIY